MLVTNAFSFLSEPAISDITVMGEGVIVESGKYEELLSLKGEFWHLNGGEEGRASRVVA